MQFNKCNEYGSHSNVRLSSINWGIDHAPKARRKNDVQCFTPVSNYLLPHLSVYVYIISVVVSDPRHTLLKSHRSKTGIIYMQSWKQCDLLVITSMALSQLMHLAYDEQSCKGTSCAKGLICHIVIVVAGRAPCFHDCINLVPIYIYSVGNIEHSPWEFWQLKPCLYYSYI